MPPSPTYLRLRTPIERPTQQSYRGVNINTTRAVNSSILSMPVFKKPNSPLRRQYVPRLPRQASGIKIVKDKLETNRSAPRQFVFPAAVDLKPYKPAVHGEHDRHDRYAKPAIPFTPSYRRYLALI